MQQISDWCGACMASGKGRKSAWPEGRKGGHKEMVLALALEVP